MNEIEHDTAPQGSSLYYSLLKVKNPKRHAIISIQAFANELAKISERYMEPGIAKVKLQWWKDEIDRMFKQQSRHPITQALQTEVERYNLSKQAFLALIEASILSIEIQAFSTQAQLAQHYQHLGGITESLKAQVLLVGEKTEQIEQTSHLLGICNETVRHIDYFAEFWGRNHIYLPIEDIEKTGFMIEQVDAQKLKSLLKIQADFARQCYQDAIAVLPQEFFKTLRPLSLYSSLQLKQLTLIEKDGFQVLTHRVELSPIRKLIHSLLF